MKILVCGGRDFYNYKALCEALARYADDTILVHGDAKGADRLAGMYAMERGWQVKVYPADWNQHGKAAGPIRNRLMLSEEHPELIVAFPGGRGTANMIEQSTQAGVEVRKVECSKQC